MQNQQIIAAGLGYAWDKELKKMGHIGYKACSNQNEAVMKILLKKVLQSWYAY